MAPLIAVFVALVALSVVTCAFIAANPETAASVIAGRSGNWLTLLLFRSVLYFSTTDVEPDLAPGTPFPDLVRNCRRRAIGRLQLFIVAVVILVLVSVMNGHVPRITLRMGS